MKKVLLVISGILILTSFAFGAEETLTANLALSSTIGAQCTPSMGKGQQIVWKGVTDKRSAKAVGVLIKKDQETEVVAAEPVEKLLEKGLKTMFEKCGYTFAAGTNANGAKVSVELTEFFAGSKKGLVTGETDAKGTMRMNIVKEGRSVDFEFGGQVHDKGLRKKNVKKIESTLSDVLAMMINNVTSTNQFSEAMKDLSK